MTNKMTKKFLKIAYIVYASFTLTLTGLFFYELICSMLQDLEIIQNYFSFINLFIEL